jgi:hypothetical protein
MVDDEAIRLRVQPAVFVAPVEKAGHGPRGILRLAKLLDAELEVVLEADRRPLVQEHKGHLARVRRRHDGTVLVRVKHRDALNGLFDVLENVCLGASRASTDVLCDVKVVLVDESFHV